MNLETVFYCALSGGLLAYGLGCGSDPRPDPPTVVSLGEYAQTQMNNGRTQLYGNTSYDVVVECIGSKLGVERSSAVDKVWFDYEFTNQYENSPQMNVTVTPDQQGSWSAKVIFRCLTNEMDKMSEPLIVNFCKNGPCSLEEKP